MTDTTSTTSSPAADSSAADSIALDDLAQHVELLRTVEDQIARLTSLKSSLRGTLKKRLGGIEIGTVGGVPVVTWKTTLRVALLPKLVKERHPEIVHDCEEITEVRTFLLLDAA